MMFRKITIALALVGSLLAVNQAQARYNTEERQAIKATPLLERPYRVGHFYGNTVRRNYTRTHGGLPDAVDNEME
jgi:hypothetical protein